jgi:lysophospholipase L1-like esterase
VVGIAEGSVPRKIKKRVGVFGHSFVGHYNGHYTRKLNEFCPNVKFEAHGKGNNRVSWAVARLRRIKRGQYDEIIIHTGVNDIAGWETGLGKKLAELREKLQRAIKIAKNKGVGRIILVEATPWKGYGTWNEERGECTIEYNRILSELAKEEGVEVVELYDFMEGEPGKLKEEYAGDSLHPNREGFEVIAKRIAESKYPQWVEIGGYVPLGSEGGKRASGKRETYLRGSVGGKVVQ